MLEEKVKKFEGLTPWEEENERETKIAQRTSLTRSQWWDMGRKVIASNAEAVKTITVRSTGNTLYLFSEEQTEERYR
jgi:hypothetical protein